MNQIPVSLLLCRYTVDIIVHIRSLHISVATRTVCGGGTTVDVHV